MDVFKIHVGEGRAIAISRGELFHGDQRHGTVCGRTGWA